MEVSQWLVDHRLREKSETIEMRTSSRDKPRRFFRINQWLIVNRADRLDKPFCFERNAFYRTPKFSWKRNWSLSHLHLHSRSSTMASSSDANSLSFELNPDFGLKPKAEGTSNTFSDWLVRQKFIREVYLILLFQQIQATSFMFFFARV